MTERTPEQIRASIEYNRKELGNSLVKLRNEVVKLSDWRAQAETHRKPFLTTGAVVGFALGGGVAAVRGVLSGRRKKRRW